MSGEQSTIIVNPMETNTAQTNFCLKSRGECVNELREAMIPKPIMI